MKDSRSDRENNDFETTKFTARNEEGVEIELEVLFTFDSDETKGSYIVYTDNTKDEAGNIRVYASKYISQGDNIELLPIKTDREWQIVETILASTQEE